MVSTQPPVCRSCTSFMQALGDGFRCPWAYGTHFLRTEVDGVVYVSCDRPYKRHGEIEAPIRGSVNR